MIKRFFILIFFIFFTSNIWAQKKEYSIAIELIKSGKKDQGLKIFSNIRSKNPEFNKDIYLIAIKEYKSKFLQNKKLIDSVVYINLKYYQVFKDTGFFLHQKLWLQIAKNNKDSICKSVDMLLSYSKEKTDQNYFPIFYQCNPIDSVYYSLQNYLSNKHLFNKNTDNIVDSLAIMYLKNGTINEKYINEGLKPLFLRKNNVVVAKYLQSYIVNLKMTKDSVYFKAYDLILNKEPNYPSFKRAGIMAMREQKNKSAIKYLESAINIAPNLNAKNECRKLKADNLYILGLKSDAKNELLLIYKSDTTEKSIFNTLGIWYESSFKECEDKFLAKQKTIYIAAYNMYLKANNKPKCEELRKKFPLVEDLYLAQFRLGQTQNTGCWINEDVIIQVAQK